MISFWDLYATVYDSLPNHFQPYQRLLEQVVEEVSKYSDKGIILDAGCGTGNFSMALAKRGYDVVGIDYTEGMLKRAKRKKKNAGIKNIELLKLDLEKELVFPDNYFDGIISVHTPIPDQTTASNKFVKEAIENFLSTSKSGDVIILESSVGGGTTEEMQKIVELQGYKIGQDYGFCFCPERIDPQNKKWHLENIPRIIYCSDDTSFKIAEKIYKNVNKAHLHRVDSPRIAEAVKSYENAFRLVNISLVNELAILCDKLGIKVMDNIILTPSGSYYSENTGCCISKERKVVKNYGKSSR